MRTTLADAIDRTIGDVDGWVDTPVEVHVFGTADAGAIAELIDRWCTDHLGAGIRSTLDYHTSVGCTALLELTDGQRVACKAYQQRWTPAFLAATRTAQRALFDRGFPIPEPLVGPLPCGPSVATADRWVELPTIRPTFDAAARSASAASLAGLVELLRPLANDPAVAALHPHPLDAPPGELYPEPHSPIFDFAATAADATWIDELASAGAAARDHLVMDRTIAHCDWSMRNVHVVDGTYVMAFDWDSLALVPETTAVGQAAQTWCATGDPESPSFPDPASVAAYVDDYDTARSTRFTSEERRAIGGAALFNLCYIARCELAVAHRWPAIDHGQHATAILRTHGDQLLDLGRLR